MCIRKQALHRRASNYRYSREHGVTLVEMVIAILISAVAVATLLQLVASTQLRSSDAMVKVQALAIAKAYMEEILAQSFADCPGDGGSRASYNSVCDYNGLVDEGAKDQTGTTLTGLSRYRVSVVVNQGQVAGTPIQYGDPVANANDVLYVEVTVLDPLNQQTQIAGFKMR